MRPRIELTRELVERLGTQLAQVNHARAQHGLFPLSLGEYAREVLKSSAPRVPVSSPQGYSVSFGGED